SGSVCSSSCSLIYFPSRWRICFACSAPTAPHWRPHASRRACSAALGVRRRRSGVPPRPLPPPLETCPKGDTPGVYALERRLSLRLQEHGRIGGRIAAQHKLRDHVVLRERQPGRRVCHHLHPRLL